MQKFEPWDFAFPFPPRDNHAHLGMTKREYFAAAVLSNLALPGVTQMWTAEAAAEKAVQYADALIDELNKDQDNGND